MPLVLIHTGIVKYLWQFLILYSIQFAYPTYSRSPFSDEIAIMIRHYVIHPYLKIRHYVIHPTIFNILKNILDIYDNDKIKLIKIQGHVTPSPLKKESLIENNFFYLLCVFKAI